MDSLGHTTESAEGAGGTPALREDAEGAGGTPALRDGAEGAGRTPASPEGTERPGGTPGSRGARGKRDAYATTPWRRTLLASTALIKADIAQLARSWVLRGWLIALALAEFFTITTTVVGNRGAAIPASMLVTTTLAGFLLVWSTLIIVLSAGSVAPEADIISDSILSRACTRNQFIAAKIISRAGVILAVYGLAAGSTAFVAYRYAAADVTTQTLITSIGIVGLAILLLVALGVLFSVVFNNTVVSVVALLLLWYVASPIFSFMGADYLSPASLIRNLPAMLKDPQAPQVVQCSATETSVSVAFSKHVDPRSAEDPSAYTIESPPGVSHQAETATYDRPKTTVTLSGLTLTAGEKVTVTVRGVTDPGGTTISAASDTATCTVPGGTVTAKQDKGRKPPADRTAPRLTGLEATPSSLRALFSEPLDVATAEDPTHYLIENPIGNRRTARAATYRADTRSVLLSGLELDLAVPVKLTVTEIRDVAGNPVSVRGNSIVHSEVTPWKYVLGFGLPALCACLLAVVWFNRRDL